MFGRCSECKKVAFAWFEMHKNSRPYTDAAGNMKWTKERVYNTMLCAECGFSIINKRWSYLADEGKDEHWLRGDFYSQVRMIEVVPSGEAYLELARRFESDELTATSRQSPRKAEAFTIGAARPRMRA